MAQISYGTITITDTTDIDRIEHYYLTTAQTTGVEKTDGEWGTWYDYVIPLSAELPVLWEYMRIIGTGDVPIDETAPHIIGTYGRNGQNGTNGKDGNDGSDGENGKGIVSIQYYFLITEDYAVPLIDYYIPSGDTTVQSNVNYYILQDGSYILVENTSGKNPSTEGWYVQAYQWQTNPNYKQLSSTNKYEWTYTSITYTTGEVENTDPAILTIYGDKGDPGDPGQDGISSIIHIRYNNNSTYTGSSLIPQSDTVYIGICVSNSDSDPGATGNWVWSKYIGEDGKAISEVIPLYYLETNGASVAQPQNEQNIGIDTLSPNVWSIKIPTYIVGGTYWTCIKTILHNTTESPIYSTIHVDSSLNDTKGSIQDLKIKTAQFYGSQAVGGYGVAGGIENITFNAENVNTFGFNTIAAPNYFAIRYNDKKYNEINQNGIILYNPNYPVPQLTIDNNGLNIYKYNENTNINQTIAQYGEISRIGIPDKQHIKIDDEGIKFYSGAESTDPEPDNYAAIITGDFMEINRTLSYSQVQVGKWEWNYGDDESITLKWIGE